VLNVKLLEKVSEEELCEGRGVEVLVEELVTGAGDDEPPYTQLPSLGRGIW
jgi:hypothetical protein